MKKILLLIATLFVALTAQAVDYEILSTNSDKLTFTSYVVKYTSVAADGVTPVEVSGVVTVPALLFLANTDVLVVDNHHTVSDNASAPSVQGGSASCIGTSGAGLGAFYPMAAPDYYGYGITKDEMHPYLSLEQNARNSLDLIPVALDILATQYSIAPKMLYNIGYSQGAGVALAAMKLLENDAQYTGLKESFPRGVHAACGDGPYDPAVVGRYMYDHADKVLFPALLPFIVNGFLSSAPQEQTEGIKFDDFFQPALLTPTKLVHPVTGETVEYPGLEALVKAKFYNNDELGAIMALVCGGKSGMADFFSDAMMDKESDLYKRVFSWMDQNSLLSGWQPEGEVLLYQLQEDDIIPVQSTELAAEALHIPADRVHYYQAADLEIAGDNKHTQFAPTFFKELISAISNSYTSLDAIETELDAEAPCYDLQGRRVGADYHGVVIQRGIKFMK